MAVKRGGLGKGLDSLIPDMNVGSTASPKTEVKTKIVEKVVEKEVEKVKRYHNEGSDVTDNRCHHKAFSFAFVLLIVTQKRK